MSERIVGIALRSRFGSHNAHYLKRQSSRRLVKNVPTVNIIVRRDDYLDFGGMDERLFGGEDVEFCARLMREGQTILYLPEILVYHKNRSFSEFVIQRLVYGAFAMSNLIRQHRDSALYLTRTIIISQLPTAFVLFLISGIAIAFVPLWAYIWLPITLLYLSVIVFEASRHADHWFDIPGAVAALAVATLAPGVGGLATLLRLAPSLHVFYRNDR